MNEEQQKNIEKTIDGLCKNLVWTWAYYRGLFALHEVGKSSPNLLDPYPQFISCLYHGLFDALFLKKPSFSVQDLTVLAARRRYDMLLKSPIDKLDTSARDSD